MSTKIDKVWEELMTNLYHQELPYSKKNWGNPNHSLCSYQGKIKPAIAYHLVKTFVPNNGRVLDPFSGVGTIPFEASLNGIQSYGIDISPLAYYVSTAKVNKCNKDICIEYINQIKEFILTNPVQQEYYRINSEFGYNKTLKEYYNENTFQEILAARLFFQQTRPKTPEQMMVISSLLHILHGNRPYALSRKSHPIVPYAPTGDYVYKSLIEKVTDKVLKSVEVELPINFKNGKIFLGDSTTKWDDEINNLDAIITSPPFFDSTRFYLANWIRLWFTGWNQNEFDTEPVKYVDEKQKKDFDIYDSIFEQAKERLKDGGYFVMHLGKSKKCNMGEVLKEKSKFWFSKSELYDESVAHCAKFGIKDLGTVTSHQYLVMR